MKILAFAASNSRQSINQTLAKYAATLMPEAEVETLDIHDYEMPIFSMEREEELGQPDEAKAFLQRIKDADALIISFAEHNGNVTAAYKNLFDWTSRIETKLFQGKALALLATSPGKGGAANVLKLATASAPHFGADVRGSFSLPSFFENFDMDTNEIRDKDLRQALSQVVASLDGSDKLAI